MDTFKFEIQYKPKDEKFDPVAAKSFFDAIRPTWDQAFAEKGATGLACETDGSGLVLSVNVLGLESVLHMVGRLQNFDAEAERLFPGIDLKEVHVKVTGPDRSVK